MGATYSTTKQSQYARYLKPICWSLATTGATYTAGRVYLWQIDIPQPVITKGITVVNVATVAGNITVGIYAEGSANVATNGKLLVQSSSTAQTGIGIPQEITLPDTILQAGTYYLAVEISDPTATYARTGNTINTLGSVGYYDRGGGYGTLTDPCPSFNTSSGTVIGMILRVQAL